MINEHLTKKYIFIQCVIAEFSIHDFTTYYFSRLRLKYSKQGTTILFEKQLKSRRDDMKKKEL